MRHPILYILLLLSLIGNILMGSAMYYQNNQYVEKEKIENSLTQMGYDLAAAIKFSTYQNEDTENPDYQLMKAQQLLDNMLTLSANTSDDSRKSRIIHKEIKQWESYISTDQPFSIKQMNEEERRHTGELIGKAFSSESSKNSNII
ncbi:hypothetical protein ACE1TI_11345 [Alteribacillus sp. JSM 102045]|uniref:hypothetical protein n=1 Tax=Alteribacillus sp. JSM 102045 TaxID=1562101 RepID=UPI0035C189BC